MTINHKNQKRRANPSPEEDEDPYSAQGKLEYLRGPAGERDRRTIWKSAQGKLPGTGEGGLLEGWLSDAN